MTEQGIPPEDVGPLQEQMKLSPFGLPSISPSQDVSEGVREPEEMRILVKIWVQGGLLIVGDPWVLL